MGRIMLGNAGGVERWRRYTKDLRDAETEIEG